MKQQEFNKKDRDMMTGKIIRFARKKKNLTQEELGKRLGYTDKSAKQAISQIERGEVSLPMDKQEQLRQFLALDEESVRKIIEENPDEFKAASGGDLLTSLKFILPSVFSLLAAGILAGVVSKRAVNSNSEKESSTDSGNSPYLNGNSDDEDRKSLKSNDNLNDLYKKNEKDIEHLKSLLDRGLITEEVFQKHLDKLLNDLYK